jgi:glycerophosphoryl diester phosphodiesterase
MPENSIVSFQHALQLGADGVELDVVVNRDKQLVVSHEPFFQSEFCFDSIGNRINHEKTFNIYEMTQEEIRRFDCGSLGNSRYPEQQSIAASKPLFSEFLSQVNMAGKTLLFEVKSSPVEYGRSQPAPEEYVSIILEEMTSVNDSVDLIIMSFDRNILEEVNKRSPGQKMVYLTYQPIKGVKGFLDQLSFKPYALGMFYPTVSKRKISRLKKMEVQTFCWTLNDSGKARKFMRWGIDGIITDYPDRVGR